MGGHARSSRLTHERRPDIWQQRRWAARARGTVAVGLLLISSGCSQMGVLEFVEPVSPVMPDTVAGAKPVAPEALPVSLQPLFGDTLVGFRSGSGDSLRRYLGRLNRGYVLDTLEIFVCGDNRPSYRTTQLRSNLVPIRDMVSLSPVKWAKGLINIPIFLFRAFVPDLKLVRDMPALITRKPNFGRERQVVQAMIATADSIEARGGRVAAVINSGDLVKDGRYPEQWERFLDITRPLSRRVPYFPIAGNHERTDDSLGLLNWQVATGLPIQSDRLYYCFDSADGWVRFLALDSNPMTDPHNHWSRETEVAYSQEQVDWLRARIAEHDGPALVFLHHPPFSLGFHRVEWQSDSVLIRRRNEMVNAMHSAGLSLMVAGHEHAYERALLQCGDDVMIVLVSGGAGSPLHDIPINRAPEMFAEYNVPGCEFDPEHVVAARIFSFTRVRIWFGGGELITYRVDRHGRTEVVDRVQIDLERYGVPKVDEQKVPIKQEKPTQPPPEDEKPGQRKEVAAGPDSARADVKPVSNAKSGGTR